LVEFLHFDIQSTGQKSHCVNTTFWPSQCYVLIRQSDSPCPYQFQVKSSRADAPFPWSQSFSQSYGSILPTSLIYIVLSTRGCSPWRPAAVMSTTRCEIALPLDFHGSLGTLRTLLPKVLCLARNPPSDQVNSRVKTSQKEKKTLPRVPTDVSKFTCVAANPPPSSGILTGCPFDSRACAL